MTGDMYQLRALDGLPSFLTLQSLDLSHNKLLSIGIFLYFSSPTRVSLCVMIHGNGCMIRCRARDAGARRADAERAFAMSGANRLVKTEPNRVYFFLLRFRQQENQIACINFQALATKVPAFHNQIAGE